MTGRGQEPRKKPRGGRRRLRELEGWRRDHLAVDPSALEGPDYVSAEFWFERWPRPLSLPLRRLVVRYLVEIHDAWAAQLRGRAEPGYLGIWIEETEFTGSQVCAAAGPRAEDYLARHAPGGNGPPPPDFHCHPCDLSRFEWTRDEWTEREIITAFDRAEWPSLLRSADAVEGTGEEAVLLFRHVSWYGKLPA